MQQFKFSLIGSALLFGLLATNAESNVIYNWHDALSDPDVGPISTSIAFDESVWAFGGTFVYNSSSSPSAGPQRFFGVESIDFATPVNLSSTPNVNRGFTDPIQLSQSTCAQSTRSGMDPGVYCAGRGLAIDDMVVTEGNWKFDLTFGEFLQGSMYLNDFSTDVGMNSQDTMFTITSLGSDSPGPCFHPNNCVGGTGYWMLDHRAMPVSEPSTVLLLTLGLIPLVVAQRRRVVMRRTNNIKTGSLV